MTKTLKNLGIYLRPSDIGSDLGFTSEFVPDATTVMDKCHSLDIFESCLDTFASHEFDKLMSRSSIY